MFAILTKKSFWAFLVMIICVWIPYGLHKIGITNEYIAFLVNPFFVFFVILCILALYLYRFFKPSPVSLLILSGMFAIDFIYVYVFYIV